MTNPIVFLCGPDMCGKTEIAKALADRLRVPYYKASAERKSFVDNQERFINDIKYACPARLDLLRQMDSGIVYDRGYPCEAAYSTFFKRKTDIEAIKWLDTQYAELGAVIVFPVRSTYAGIRDDLNISIDESVLLKLEGMYQMFLSTSKCRVLELNVDDENLERELEDILTFMGYSKDTQKSLKEGI